MCYTHFDMDRNRSLDYALWIWSITCDCASFVWLKKRSCEFGKFNTIYGSTVNKVD